MQLDPYITTATRTPAAPQTVGSTVDVISAADLARRVADSQPLLAELTQAQEKAVIADKKLLLTAICVLSQWTLEQVTENYRLTQAECIKYFAQLDRIGIIELKPMNR